MNTRNLITAFFMILIGTSCSNAQDYNNPTIKTIHERTSVREYSTQEVESETLIQLVKAGMAAPTAMNKQPWEFVIVTDREILNRLGETKPPVKKAQAAIVVLGNTQTSTSWVIDCSAATQNILLAATSLGLGTVWTGAHGNAKFEQEIIEALSLPENIMPLNVIAIGYPIDTPQPKDKFVESKIHYNKF
ncbi:MAG: nitroreductase family protein [Rikenellaceae bacterium]